MKRLFMAGLISTGFILMLLVSGCSNQAVNQAPTGNQANQSSSDSAKISELKTKAEKGDAEAQYELGICYQAGTGVPKDEKEGVRWFKLAADQGHAKAQFCLCNSYDFGVGTEVNYEEAYMWGLLAKMNSAHEGVMLEPLMKTLDKKLTQEQKDTAQKKATELFNKPKVAKKTKETK